MNSTHDAVGTDLEEDDFYLHIDEVVVDGRTGFGEPADFAYVTVIDPEGESHYVRLTRVVKEEEEHHGLRGGPEAECWATLIDEEKELVTNHGTVTHLFHFSTDDVDIEWEDLLEELAEQTHQIRYMK